MTVKTIVLAGRDWPVPILAIKQNRIVVPAIMDIMPMFVKIMGAMSTKDQDPAWFSKIKLSTEEIDKMADAIYVALTKATPGLSRTEFDNLEISPLELLSALPIIAQQTGLLKQDAASQEPSKGEAEAGNLSTSMPSSAPTAQEPASDGLTN